MPLSQDSHFGRTQISYESLADFILPSPKIALHHSSVGQHITHQQLHDFVRGINIPVTNHGSLKKPVVAILLPNGPLLAATVMATAAWYIAAPINPAAGPEQVAADIALSGASAIVSCPQEVEKLQLHRTDLSVFVVDVQGNGIAMKLASGTPPLGCTRPVPNSGQDTSIILFTSGTSGNKKVVPMSTHSIVCGVGYVIDSWGLQATDVCLNMMPLYHV
jgi:acyl-coenzyme A synthetase/AMP-(fatty) acid ligase